MVPGLDELRSRIPAEWDGGRALLSMVDVGDLASLIATLATGPAAQLVEPLVRGRSTASRHQFQVAPLTRALREQAAAFGGR